MPATELAQFESNLDYAHQMAATASALSSTLTGALDVSDLLRAALVQGVSAFDYFIHEEVRVRMHAVHSLPPSNWHPAFCSFTVTLTSVAAALTGSSDWLDDEIRRQHGHQSFQHPDKVAAAMRLATDTPLWPTVATQLGSDPATVRRRLQLIVDRRNKIAHEADTDPTPPASRYPISRVLVDDSLDFLKSVAKAIASTP